MSTLASLFHIVIQVLEKRIFKYMHIFKSETLFNDQSIDEITINIHFLQYVKMHEIRENTMKLNN